MGFAITVQELKEKLDRGEQIVLIDVREPWEYNICKIPGAQLIPLGALGTEYKKLDPNAEIELLVFGAQRAERNELSALGTEYKKLDPNAEIVLHCHMGMRSM